MQKKDKKKFNIFDRTREKKGVDPGEVKDFRFRNFPRYFGRNFTKLMSVNLMFSFCCLPLIFLLLGMTGYFDAHAQAPVNSLYGTLYGTMELGQTNPVSLSLYGIVGVQYATVRMTSVVTYILYGLSLITVFTWGYANAGLAYVTRSMMRGDPVFVWQDFRHVIRKNKRQGMILGVLDALFIFLLIYDFLFFNVQAGQYLYGVLYFVSIFLIVVYAVMRFYMYLQLITFDLSIYKILKNSFIFVFLGLKRNVVGILLVLLMAGLNYVLFRGVFMPVAIVLPFVLTAACIGYTATYTAYPKIKEIMIDPYYQSDTSEEN